MMAAGLSEAGRAVVKVVVKVVVRVVDRVDAVIRVTGVSRILKCKRAAKAARRGAILMKKT